LLDIETSSLKKDGKKDGKNFWEKYGKRLAQTLFVLTAIGFFLVKSSDAIQISRLPSLTRLPLLLGAVFFQLLNFASQLWIWRSLSRPAAHSAAHSSERAPLSQSYRLFAIASISRYLPAGKVLQFFSIAAFTPPGASKGGSHLALSYGVLSLAGWISGLLVLLLGLPSTGITLGLLAAICIVWASRPLILWAAALHPRLELLRELEPRLYARTLFHAILMSLLFSWLPECISAFLVVVAIAPETPWSQFFPIASSVAAASFAGYLAFFAPAGIGVRDLALASLLEKSLGSSDAYLASLLLRLTLTASEIVFVLPLIWTFWERGGERKPGVIPNV
jgi:hypothetical protein